ncbi:sugar phosphate nucleotidyltransferase [Caloranaerobacter sp. TR13]|uniref:sugar phosphate nucleotidyltransferase n=1 Tax=Caloranaerobacter sp. TR13 TaxID=1302151 RepID=UPI0009E8D315|nr:sugar phosphate nucleotidyltransferase [Caloranaerobacter sp. TR13]
MDLFTLNAENSLKKQSPLAERMRPKTLEEFIGQEHIVGKGRLLYRAIQADKLTSLILHGPPGTGKTTLARIIANTTKLHFEQLNAVTSGIKDIREIIEISKERLGFYNKRTILFIDEIHRFNKSQQDALLPYVENGTIILIGATTENPYFEVNKALISRSMVFKLEPLTKEQIKIILLRALKDKEIGIIKVIGDKIIEIKEKPKRAISNMAVTGVYLFDKSIFKACRNIKPSKRGEYEITDAIMYLIDNGYKVTFNETKKWWMDLGTPDDIFKANKYLLNKINTAIEGNMDDTCKIYGKVKIGRNTKLINSYIKGPVFIGKNSFISNCIIEPYTIIGDNVNIKNIKVEESSIYSTVFLKNSKIHIVKSIVIDNTVYYKTKNNKFNHYSI